MQRIFRVRKNYFYNWDTDPDVRKAVQCIVNGDSFHMAYKKTGIGPQTIKKFYTMYVKDPVFFEKRKKKAESSEADHDTSVTVFTNDQDATLMKCLKHFEFLFDGLTEKECRMLAYQMVISEDMKIPLGWKHGMASIAWLTSFRLRHSSFMLELKKPSRICANRYRKTLQRESNWEKNTVANFYDNLEKYIQQFPEIKDNKRIYSLDEAYMSINPDSKTTADRDSRSDLFTVCCFICADGTNLPPVVVKPYRASGGCSDISTGGVALTGSRGQMTPDLFTEVMHYFVKHSHSSLSNPSILIMDTDLCHLSYAAVTLAKESGVQLLTVHTHVSNLLQPLQRQLFESFYTSYYDSLEAWLGEKDDLVTCKASDIGNLIHETYTKVMTHDNIVNAFKKCGISPFDRDLFTDSDYLSCLDQVEQTCIECKIRDDRSRKLDLDKTADSVDESGQNQVPSGESQGEEPEKPGDGGESSQTQETKGGEMLNDNNMTPPRTQGGQELDKLKRRLIRSIARLMKEKKTEEEVWEEMKKECGKNCQALWLRMKSLTLKKLKRLIDADDRYEHVPAVARMTLTDWLLCDLILVHEKIDVINRSSTGESKVLNNLFSLVQRFQVEGRSGDDLADAWTAATVSYNSKGHQCSPMLMQRRWYQVKELTRHKLYQFWFNYRGNERLLITAKQDPPTALQRAVALRYPEIITKYFPSWEERIEKKLVIMPEEFEIRMTKKDLMKPPDETIPDVEIIEKKIDTITVESDSDFDDDQSNEASTFPNPEAIGNDGTTQIPLIVQVKTEPQDPNDDIDITEHPVYPEKRDRFQDAIEKLTIEEYRVAMSHVNTGEQEDCTMPLITNVVGAVNETITSKTTNNRKGIDLENRININSERNEILQNTSISLNDELESAINTFDNNSQQSIVIDDDEDDVLIADIAQNKSTPDVNRITSNVIDITSPNEKRTEMDDGAVISAQSAYSEKTDTVEHSFSNVACPVITAVLSGSLVEAKMEIEANIINKEHVDKGMPEVYQDSEEIMEDIITIEPDKEVLDSGRATIITNVADEGFEFADDGIEYDEHNDQSELIETPEKINVTTENGDTPKFDLKLLMHPVVYTTKLDDMEVFKGRSFFDTIDEKCLVDKIFLQSKPISTKAVRVEQIKAENEEVASDIQVTEDNSEEFDDDLFQNESSNESDIINPGIAPIDDSQRVKLSSSLLQKPRSRRYNPIQLCKNPDFNTRLKRLPLGFYSSERNRVFLKACKPMTIDLSKSFESKLINGTMYLRPSDSIITAKLEEIDKSESTASVTPSAVAVQSLMDTTDVDKILQDELRKRMLERNKTITLPNISVVRQINQHLLMAEVAPIMTQVEKSTHEVSQALNNNSCIEKTNNINTQTKETRNETPPNPVTQSSQISDTINQSSANSVMQTTPLINSDKSIKDTVSDSLLPMLNNDKPKEDKVNEKQRKKYEKLNVNKPLWLPKYSVYDSKPTESLLTIDTLYKVLNALDPTSVDYKKPKKKIKSKTGKQGRPPLSGTIIQNQATDNLDSSDQITTNSGNSTEQSPSNSLSNAPSVATPTISKKTNANSSLPKKQKNCCWARSKINKINGVVPKESKHRCPKAHCRCCCKEILRQTEINNEIKLLESMQLRDQFDETIEQVGNQSRESQNVIPSVTLVNPTIVQGTQNQSVYEDLTNVVMSSIAHVRHPRQVKVNTQLLPQTTRKSVGKDIGIQADIDEDDDVTLINNTPEDTQPQEIIDSDISENESEVTIDLIDDEDNISASEIQTPTPKIRVYAGGPSACILTRVLTRSKKNWRNPTLRSVTPIAPPLSNVPPTSPLPLMLPATSLPNVSTNTPTELSPAPLPHVYPKGKKVDAKMKAVKTPTAALNSSSKDIGTSSALPCSCKPNVVVDKLSATLVVDGSIECPQHSRSRISKETRIYLNRRHMSAAARPFYVGKNKILLTNITPRKAQLPPPPLVSQAPLELPPGVQVVLLADGTLSYLVNPGVELTVEEKNAMPIILASVLEQVKASGIALPIDDLTAQENTPVNATIDDENDENTNRNSQHNESDKLNAEVLSTEPLPEFKNSNSDTAILHTEKNESSQESSNQVKSVPENQKNVNHVSLVPTYKDETISNDTLVGKDNTGIDVNNTESCVYSEPALNTNDLDASTEDCISEAQENNDPVQGTENKNAKNNETDIMVENDKTSNATENVETNNNGEHDITAENVETNKDGSEETSKTAETVEISNVSENYEMNSTVSNGQLNNKTQNENTSFASSSRNLLSDLMEMSGILEEDVNPIQQQPVNTSPGTTKPLTLDMSQNSLVPPLSPIPEKHEICARINEKTYNLNPITSFAELKYACDNKGLFFKLDLNNGVIVPINVCIQKTHESAANAAIAKQSSEVIDLTDDQSFTIEDSDTNAQSVTLVEPSPKLTPETDNQTKNKMKLHIIKPKDISLMLKKRGRGRPPKLKSILLDNNIDEKTPPQEQSTISASMEERKIALMKRLSNNLKPLKFHSDKRTPIILRKNAMSNNNTPILKRISNLQKKIENEIYMETEYLLDSSEDSDDDEPLAKIAKKMRSNESSEVTNAEESQGIPQSTETEDDNVDFEDAIDAISSVEPPTILNSLLQDEPMDHDSMLEEVGSQGEDDSMTHPVSQLEDDSIDGPVPTQLVLSGAALEQPLPPAMHDSLNFVDSESEENSDNDCILGV